MRASVPHPAPGAAAQGAHGRVQLLRLRRQQHLFAAAGGVRRVFPWTCWRPSEGDLRRPREGVRRGRNRSSREERSEGVRATAEGPMPDGSERFAERLKQLREAAGLTSYALAKKAGLSRQVVSQLELARQQPTWK